MSLDELLCGCVVVVASWAIARRFASIGKSKSAPVIIGGALARGMRRAHAKRTVPVHIQTGTATTART
jgi:hypothetical protein